MALVDLGKGSYIDRLIEPDGLHPSTLQTVVPRFGIARYGRAKYLKGFSTGAYSAIVYKEGDSVIAEDKLGNKIAEGEAGVDDASVILNTINLLKTTDNWERIVFRGDFLINTPIDIIGANKLILEGGYFKQNANIDHIIGISDTHADTSHNIIMRDMTVENPNASAYHSNNIVVGNLKGGLIENVHSIGAWRHALSVLRTNPGLENAVYLPENITVRNCYFSKSSIDTKAGCILMGGRHNRIENCEIDGKGSAYSGDETGLNIYDNTFNRSYDIVVRNIYVHDVGGHGIDCSVSDVLIDNPRIINAGKCGIRITPNGEQIVNNGYRIALEKNVEVRKPYIKGAKAQGIYIADMQDVTIENPTVEFNKYIGIVVYSKLIYDATTLDFATACEIRGGIVRDNCLESDSHGIAISADDNQVHIVIDGIKVFDDQETPTQTKAMTLYGTMPIKLRVFDSLLSGDTYNFKNANTAADTEIIMRRVEGYTTENSGTATFSGDGSTTQFSIEHGLVSTPSKIQVTAMSSDAAGDFYVTADATYIYVNYKTAPPSGTDNVKISFYAEV